jgi:hypothetical protein
MFVFGIAEHAFAFVQTYVANVQNLYHLEDYADSIGSNNFTNNGSSIVTGLFNDGVDTNGGNVYTTSTINLATSSLSFWFETTNSSYQPILSWSNTTTTGANCGVDMNISGGGHIRFYDGRDQDNDTSANVDDGNWHNVIVENNSGGAYNMYLDGSLILTRSSNSSQCFNGTYLNLGYWQGQPAFNGTIDDVAVTNDWLSPTEIANIWNSGTGAQICGVFGCDGSGSSTPEVSVVSGTLEQYQPGGTTTIAEGEMVPRNSIVFSGEVESNDTTSEQLRVEVTTSTIFSDTANASSVLVSPGTDATATASSLALGSYYWQAMAEDGNGITSTWQTYGPTSTSTDFRIIDPSIVIAQQDYLSESSDPSTDNVETLDTLGSGTVSTLELYLPSAPYGSGVLTINLDACTGQTYGTNNATGCFTVDTTTSTLSSLNPGINDFTLHNDHLNPAYDYTWEAYSPSQAISLGCDLDDDSYASGSEAGSWSCNGTHQAYDFFFELIGTSTPTIANLNQYESDATTTIPDGATTTESSVIFGGTLQSSGTSTLQLQVEVKPATSSFSGTPNATSSWVNSGDEATATFSNIDAIDPSVYARDPESWSDGAFHWQARVYDGTKYSPWQTFGPTASSTDFTIQTVPLYTQEESDYPDSTDTANWASEAYDDALPGTGCGESTSTISVCGCAISSVAMWLQYYGIATDTWGNPVNPGNLNAWLEASSSGGYDDEGDLEWGAIENYATPVGGGSIVFASSSFDYDHESVSALESYIDPLINSTTPDPVILVEDNAPDGAATTEHWLVAIASSSYDGTSTYAIRDSYWYNTQYLNQPTSTDPGTVNFYNNNIDGIRVYYDPPTPPLFNEIHINLPNTLMLVDSQGRRTGKDPATGIVYREIPGATYGEDNKSGELFFSEPPKGQYSLYILGGQTGTYHLDAWIDSGKGQTPPQRISGNIQAGSMLKYLQVYNTTNLASSTFSFSTVVSSTAIVTSAPPNNLPLPSPPISSVPLIKSTIPVSNYHLVATTTTATTTLIVQGASSSSLERNVIINSSTIISSSTP